MRLPENTDRIRVKNIILDRDGVINYDSPDYIKNPEEWIPIESSMHAIAKLSKQGIKISIATNQSAVGKKIISIKSLRAIHAKLRHTVESYGGQISMISFCPHHPEENCPCRKPKTSLIQAINEHNKIDKKHDWLIGDKHSDIQAAQNFGIKSAFVLSGKTKYPPANHFAFQDLLSFVNWLQARNWNVTKYRDW